MSKIIIKIDRKTRVKIIAGNFILQRLSVSKNKKPTAWKYDGYFPTLESLCNYYLNSYPYRAIEGSRDFKELLRVVKLAQEKIKLLINNSKL
jgi:hypothetical protein